MSQSCSTHSKSRIKKAELKPLGPATISVNWCCSFNATLCNEVWCVKRLYLYLLLTNNLLKSIWKGVKHVNNPALLRDNIVILCLRLWNNHVSACMHWWGIFQNHIPQGEDYIHWILIIQGHALHFTLCCTFSGRGSKYQKRLVLRPRDSNSSIKEYRRNPPTHPSGVKHSLLFDICGVVILLNENSRVCVSTKKTPKLTQNV